MELTELKQMSYEEVLDRINRLEEENKILKEVNSVLKRGVAGALKNLSTVIIGD